MEDKIGKEGDTKGDNKEGEHDNKSQSEMMMMTEQ